MTKAYKMLVKVTCYILLVPSFIIGFFLSKGYLRMYSRTESDEIQFYNTFVVILMLLCMYFFLRPYMINPSSGFAFVFPYKELVFWLKLAGMLILFVHLWQTIKYMEKQGPRYLSGN